MWKNRSPWLLFLFGVELFCCYGVSGQCSNITACSDVRDNLTRDYNQKLKPVGLTTIHMSLDIRVLKEVDIAVQTVSVVFLLHMTWKDERLMWSDREPDYLIFGNDEIWTPNIYITDVNEKGLAGIFDDGPIPLRVLPDGTVEWSPQLITTTACEAHILYYPYDSQTDHHRVTDVLLKSNTTINSSYVNNGQWDFSSSVKTSSDMTDARGLDYSAIIYTFKFKRYSKWYIPLILIPLAILSLLMPGVFFVPASSGEKTGYTLTVMLSFTMLSAYVTETLPSVSHEPSLLGVYIAAVMACGCAIMIPTVISVFLSHKPENSSKPEDKENKVTDNREFPQIIDCSGAFLSYPPMIVMMICFFALLSRSNETINAEQAIGMVLGIPVGLFILLFVIMIVFDVICIFGDIELTIHQTNKLKPPVVHTTTTL